MKSIHSFTLSNYFVKFRCGLYSNYYKNGIDLQNFEEHEKAIKFEDSKVGTQNGQIVNKSIRDSHQVNCELFFYPIKNGVIGYEKVNIIEETLGEIQKVTPEIYSSIIDTNSFGKELYCKCIIYREGGFFKKHVDTRIKKFHFATMLIFPPADLISEHEGGVLKIWDENGKLHEFHSSQAKDWTFILFHPNLEHECTPITKGKRVIFKKEICYDSDVFRLLNYEKKIDKPIIKIPGISKKNQDQFSAYELYRKEIDEKLKQMDEIIKVKEEQNDGYPYDEIDEDCKTIQRIFTKMEYIPGNYDGENMEREHNFADINKTEKKIIIYVLDKYYPIEEERCLYENDLKFFNEIKENFPNAYLRNFEVEMNDSFKHKIFSGDSFSYDPSNDSKNIEVVYQGGHNIGKYNKTLDIYNDQDYDYYHIYSYTTIIIPKS